MHLGYNLGGKVSSEQVLGSIGNKNSRVDYSFKLSFHFHFSFHFPRYAILYSCLVGGWTNPFERYQSIRSCSQIGVKTKNVWNHHLALCNWWFMIKLTPVPTLQPINPPNGTNGNPSLGVPHRSLQTIFPWICGQGPGLQLKINGLWWPKTGVLPGFWTTSWSLNHTFEKSLWIQVPPQKYFTPQIVP